MWITRRRLSGAGAALCLVLMLGCRQDMHDQAKYEPLEESDFFADGRASRPSVAGTIPRGGLRDDSILWTGKIDGKLAGAFPFPVTMGTLKHGRERYDIFCAPCHDRVGTGRGMVVRRGFPQAASFHIDRLRKAEAGYFIDVITNGFGRMPAYAAQIPPRDRWAIVAYVRALQKSQQAGAGDVPPEARATLASQRGTR